jgi:hypothetical protein
MSKNQKKKKTQLVSLPPIFLPSAMRVSYQSRKNRKCKIKKKKRATGTVSGSGRLVIGMTQM